MPGIPDQIAALQAQLTAQRAQLATLAASVAALMAHHETINERINTHWHSEVAKSARW
jgi:cell division protein FtsB